MFTGCGLFPIRTGLGEDKINRAFSLAVSDGWKEAVTREDNVNLSIARS